MRLGLCSVLAFSVAACGGKVVLDAAAGTGGAGGGSAAQEACSAVCDYVVSCGQQTSAQCEAGCPPIVELNAASGCTSAYAAWAACLTANPTCGSPAPCEMPDEQWLLCTGAFCGQTPTPPVCSLGQPCTTDADCGAGQVCAPGAGVCVGAGGAGGGASP
jgi:Cys-rich repeat protein